MNKKKYRQSLLNMLKSMVRAMRVGSIICTVASWAFFYGLHGNPFKLGTFLQLTVSCIIFGGVLGILYRCLKGGEDEMDNHMGIPLYNMYAGINNTFVFSRANCSWGAAFSLLVLFLSFLELIYKFICVATVIPASFVYLCIMAVVEKILDGIPEGLGNVLDKLVPLAAKLCGIIVVFAVLLSMSNG